MAEGGRELDREDWRRIVLAIADGVAVLDADGVHVEVNDALCRMTGFTREELVGRAPPFGYWPAEELARIGDAFARAREGESTDFELVFCRKDGVRFPVLVHPAPIDDGGTRLFVATVKDISAQKELERDLLASRERWRSIAENPFDFVVEIDRDYRYLYVNHTAPGITASDLIGKKTPFDFVAAAHHPIVRAAFERAFAEKRSQTYEIYAEKIDRWFSSIVGPIFADGEVRSLSILTRDITESKLAVQRSERGLQLALSAGDVGAFDVDLSTGHAYLSASFHTMLGYPDRAPEFYPGLDDFLARLHPDDGPATADLMRALLERGGEVDREGRVRMASGEYRWFHCRARVFQQGDVRHLSGFLSDVTSRKRAEEERAQLERRVQHAQRLETLGTLASGIAHDFNNLLVPVLGNADLLLNGPLAREVREPIEDIRHAAMRARELVAQMLVFGRPNDERGASLLVAPALLEAANLLRRTGRANVEVTATVAEPGATILGNEGQLVQVLTNLGLNALQALGDARGHLWLCVDRVTLDDAFATRHGLRGDAVRISVKDDGPGMSAETLERAFDPFFTTKPVGQGSGLGLAMVHAIVTKHGGVIRVDSAPGAGALFELYFPALPDSEATASRPSAPTPARAAHRILVVDDFPAVLSVISLLLSEGGHHVTGVGSAGEALGLLRADRGSFDLLITDQSMPKMTGIELATALAAELPGLPVMLLSGLGEHAAGDRMPANLRAIVAKPPSGEELLDAVERVMRAVGDVDR